MGLWESLERFDFLKFINVDIFIQFEINKSTFALLIFFKVAKQVAPLSSTKLSVKSSFLTCVFLIKT